MLNFSIVKEAFLKPLRAVGGVATEKKQMQNPILSNVLLRAENGKLTLLACDQEIELLATTDALEIEQDGAITVPCRKLAEICKTLPEGATITIKQQDNNVLLTSKRCRFTLASIPAENFPVSDKKFGESLFSLKTKQLKEIIAKTAFAMAEQDVRYFLNGLFFELDKKNLTAVAADGHRLAKYSLTIDSEVAVKKAVIIPRKCILELTRLIEQEQETEVKISIEDPHIRFEYDDYVITAKLLKGRFPQYSQVIPAASTNILLGDRKSLKDSFVRASVLFSEKFKGVRLDFSKNILNIVARNNDKDEIEEAIEVNYASENIEIGFNVKYLIDFLNVAKTNKIKMTLTGSNASALLEEEGGEGGDAENSSWLYVLMPMRI